MLERNQKRSMSDLEIFIKHFVKEYPELKSIQIDEYFSTEKKYFIKIVFSDKETQDYMINTNPNSFYFADLLARGIGYSGIILGYLKIQLEYYINNSEFQYWNDPYFTSTTTTNTTYLSGITYTLTSTS